MVDWTWPAPSVPGRGRSATEPGRPASAPAPRWNGSGGGWTSWATDSTGCRR